MTITLPQRQQAFNAIFRDGRTYAEAQVKIIIQGEGKRQVKMYDATFLNYKPNHVIVNFDLDDDGSDEWKDGERYMVKVINHLGELLYTDILLVKGGGTNMSTNYVVAEDSMDQEQLEQNESDNDYIILND